MTSNKMSGPAQMTTILFGVEFIWRDPGIDYGEPTRAGLIGVVDRVAARAGGAIHRQRRDHATYWDAMTCLPFDDFVPVGLHGEREYKLAMDMVLTLETGKFDPPSLLELNTLPWLDEVRSRFEWQYGEQGP